MNDTARYAAPGAAVEGLPDGWLIQRGASGWRCVNRGRKWETKTYCDDKSGQGRAQAIAGAQALATAVERALDERERLCVGLRKAFRGD